MHIGIMSASLKGARLHENRRLIEEIEELGHQAQIINYRQTAVAVTENGRAVYGYDKNDDPQPIEVDAVIPRIGRFVESGAMVLRLLTLNGVFSTATPEAVLKAKNKMVTHMILDQAGIPTPYTISPTGVKPTNPKPTLKLIQPEAKAPTILKTNTGSHGHGVILTESRRSAVSQVQALQANSIPYLIQEFAETAEETTLASDLRLIVVDSLVIAAMKRVARDNEEFRSNLSLQGTGEPYEPTPREAELAIKSCEVLGVSVGGVDIIPSKRGPLVNEVNVSPEFGIEKVTGVNVARSIVSLAIKHFEDNKVPAVEMLEAAASGTG